MTQIGADNRLPDPAQQNGQDAEMQREQITESLVSIEALDDEPTGKSWAVTIIKSGWSKNGNYYSPDVLRDAAPLYEGTQVFDNHLTSEEWRKKPFRSVRELLGVITGVHWDEAAKAVKGQLGIVEGWLQDKLLKAAELGRLDVLGLSHTVLADRKERTVEGRLGNVVEAIKQVMSVDVVSRPSAGGAIDYVVAGDGQPEEQQEDIVTEDLRALLNEQFAELEKRLPELVKPVVESMLPQAQPEQEAQAEPETEPVQEDEKVEENIVLTEAEKRFKAAEERLQRAACAAELATRMQESKLPAAYKVVIETDMRGKIFETEELDAMIKKMADLYAATAPEPKVTGHGPATLTPQRTVESFWQKQVDIAVDGSLRMKEGYNDLPYMRLSEIYESLTGDVNLTGAMDMSRVDEAEVTTSTMAELVRNALNKRLLKGYAARDRWWGPIVTEYDEADLNQVSLVRVGSFQMLDAVSEGATYVGRDIDDKRETVDLTKYGNFVGITLEMMGRDNLRAVGRIAEELGKAAWKRVSYQLAYQFTQNSGTGPELADTNYWFDNANHGNYNSAGSALAYDTWETLVEAMYEQRDMSYNGSTHTGTAGEDELAWTPDYLLIPNELRGAANVLVGSENRPGNANNDRNVYKDTFTPIVVPNWTDNNDYVGLVSPAKNEILTLHYYRGQREPQMFRADNELVGSMFTNDEMRYKVRFWIGVGVADWRGVYKVAVA